MKKTSKNEKRKKQEKKNRNLHFSLKRLCKKRHF